MVNWLTKFLSSFSTTNFLLLLLLSSLPPSQMDVLRHCAKVRNNTLTYWPIYAHSTWAAATTPTTTMTTANRSNDIQLHPFEISCWIENKPGRTLFFPAQRIFHRFSRTFAFEKQTNIECMWNCDDLYLRAAVVVSSSFSVYSTKELMNSSGSLLFRCDGKCLKRKIWWRRRSKEIITFDNSSWVEYKYGMVFLAWQYINTRTVFGVQRS